MLFISQEETPKCRVGTVCWTDLEFSTAQLTKKKKKIIENGNRLFNREGNFWSFSLCLLALLLESQCAGNLHLKLEALMYKKDFGF